MTATAAEPIVLSSDDDLDDDQEEIDLADERPPSDEDYASSITLSSGDDTDQDEENNEETVVIEKEVNGATLNDDVVEPMQTKPVGETVDITPGEMKDITTNDKPARNKKKKSSPKKRSDQKVKKRRKPATERRNIRKILAEEKLDLNTVNAQKEEEDRKRRLAERDQLLAERARATTVAGSPVLNDTPNLKSLLTEKLAPNHNVVELLSSDDDDDCCIVVDQSKDRHDEPDEVGDDPENSGIHVDDSKNQPDSLGRVLVNVGHPDEDGDLFLSPQIGRAVKPHQIGGVRFLYDSLVESLERFRSSQGFGCILAHSMGLGKTIQVVAFTDVFMRYTKARRVLIIVPINTLQNWVNEFDMWLPTAENSQGFSAEEVTPRSFKLYFINDTHKTVSSRAKVLDQWTSDGGVLLVGYEMFRLLATRKTKTRKRRANAGPELIDIDLEERNSGLQSDMQQSLLDPGPDLVICDEGHRIKNSHAGISKSLKQINTKRRVVLTGYPLQNNLIEYWCMVDFVRPNFLGTKIEFSNMFERPIANGQCADSTSQDIRLMKYRAHVLHTLLSGFVQRRNHKVLMRNLPPKQEWVLMVKMSAFQRGIYNLFMEDLKLDTESCIGGTNPLKAFAVACKIWNHPDVMHTFLDKQAADNDDLDIYLGLTANGSVPNGNSTTTSKKIKKSVSESALMKMGRRDSPIPGMCGLNEKTAEISYDWVKPAFENYSAGVLANSGKFVLLFQIITETLRLNEKLLIFSQSLTTLNLLERFLSRMDVPLPWLNEKWAKNQTYFRLDGSTNASERERLVHQFNSLDNRDICLFLLSTKAGCLGINLTGANRVVVLDASWNPCHDCQAVCRVYRYGQDKRCFIYRLVSDNTMERKIYDRQVNKQGMADRVVDEIQVQNNLSKKENDQLLEYQDRDLPTIDPTGIEQKCVDSVLVKVIKENYHWITQNPFTHESLLIEAQEEKLTRTDKKLAKEAYEREKKLSVSFSRQSYSSYYNNNNNKQQTPPVFRGPVLPGNNMSTPRMQTPPMNPSRMQTPQMPTPASSRPGPRFGMRVGVRHEVRPGVVMQTIQAHKEFTAPGPERRVIKKGDLLTVIRTNKGTYIQLSDGKLYAVRNKRDAESFGLSDSDSMRPTSSPAPSSTQPTATTETNGTEARLTNLLQGAMSRHRAPNLVERRRAADSNVMTTSPPSYPFTSHQSAPHDTSANAMCMSMGGMATSQPTNSMMCMSDSNFQPQTGSNQMPMSLDNLYNMQRNNSSGGSGGMLPMNAMQQQQQLPYTQYPSSTGSYDLHVTQPSYMHHPVNGQPANMGMYGSYQSREYPHFGEYGWVGHNSTSSQHDHLDINTTVSQPITVAQATNDQDSTNLPNLNHMMRMRTPLILPPLDAPAPRVNHTDGYGSDVSLPSLNDEDML